MSNQNLTLFPSPQLKIRPHFKHWLHFQTPFQKVEEPLIVPPSSLSNFLLLKILDLRILTQSRFVSLIAFHIHFPCKAILWPLMFFTAKPPRDLALQTFFQFLKHLTLLIDNEPVQKKSSSQLIYSLNNPFRQIKERHHIRRDSSKSRVNKG